LPGIEDAIKASYPEALYQGCVVHLIRNSIKHVSYKDLKEFSNDMKFIYKAPTEESALKYQEAKKKSHKCKRHDS
jgi:transposase-like protein